MQGIHLFTWTERGKWTQVKSESDSFQHLSDVAEIFSEEGRRVALVIVIVIIIVIVYYYCYCNLAIYPM